MNTRRPTAFGVDLSAFSTSPSQLNEINMDSEFNMSCNTQAKVASNQGRTMKDYEEQLGALRKENFHLKLKVYFLEERLDKPHVSGSQNEIFKRNIELEVKLEGYKKEINEQQELLYEAARALEFQASPNSKENELRLQIVALEEELQLLRNTENIVKVEDIKVEDMKMEDSMNSVSVATGADDSVALYTAAFNIPRPARSENLQKQMFKANNNKCECRQLKALLTTERETTVQLRDLIASRDKEFIQQRQQLQEVSEQLQHSEAEKRIKTERKSELTSQDVEQLLEKLRQENLNACQMIQSCLVRIKQMDRENRKLKSSLEEKENIIEQSEQEGSSDNRIMMIKKYNEMLNERDSKIVALENELKTKSALKELSNSKNSSQNDDKEWNWMNNHLEKKINTLRESIYVKPKCEFEKNQDATRENDQKNLLHILTGRLQEMAYFLDSLLSNRCILGDEKRRKVENLLEQSLELPVGLKLDPSASQYLENSYMDLTLHNESHSPKLADLTKIFGHHLVLDDSMTCHIKPLDYKKLNKTIENNENNDLEIKMQQEIERLRIQLNSVKERCICRNTDDESDTKIDQKTKSMSYEYNKLLLKKSKLRMNKMNKMNLNTTWHGQEVYQIDQSESECWSEPDRSVSLARMGGPLEETNVKESMSSEDEACTCRKHPYTRQSQWCSDENIFANYNSQITTLMEEKAGIQKVLEDANNKIIDLELIIETNKAQFIVNIKQKHDEINKLNKKLDDTERALENFTSKHREMIEQLAAEKIAVEEKLKSVENHALNLEKSLIKEQQHRKSLQNEIQDTNEACNTKIKDIKEKIETEWVTRVRYEALRHELDNAALQASQATLDRTVVAEQKMRSDAEADRLRRSLTETRLRLSELENANAELQNRLVHLDSWQNSSNKLIPFPTHGSDSPQRTTSPDQGIDSDRLSSLELMEPTPSHVDYMPNDLASENVILRERLERTQRTLESTLNQLHAANSRKKKVQRAMCQEIHKTHSVLRQVRDNLTYDS
ncbi:phosphodiesterase 4D interacting protein centrosomin isoform X1 [Arctopsyche grandis]|uniref:phosphodiesterase 4D interacting protein centrosomin isoform X1 n=1 Tax=Arctopsyche grandis TaxID=121162 RepID=UPI00406D976A